ncbi:AFR494Wp [Eremothecium gossypii ATCC 10895]|uniref:Telomerase reverse transcriptase n=1 Tax=Eremothecium gossypii (strain ATCC 10895 / CBS 109.51 / FGSC 9923 / NRRL Y-1056) TaxID=284811 RepID=Q752S9_EREGS|nr:AFR494Wp [Eremothecium gossypii ATCC 10895]AAS53865.1 AFR494Wp [Eremothecium gossypii ATCC 10895]
MQCLESFIDNKLPFAIASGGNAVKWELRLLNGLGSLVQEHYVVENAEKLGLPNTSRTHEEVINQCIICLLDRRLFNNVLTYGYRLANEPELSSRLHCLYTNTSSSTLRTGLWQMLHEAIGTANFTHLLVNCSIFRYDGRYFHQVTGNALNEPHKPPIWWLRREGLLLQGELATREDIDNTGFMYRNLGIIKWRGLLPDDIEELAAEVFGELPTDMVMLRGLMAKMARNYSRVKFRRIIDCICPRRSVQAAGSNEELKSDLKLVTRLILVLVDKIVPLELFGSKRNKAKLFKRISELLALNLNSRMPFAYVITGINTNDIMWDAGSCSNRQIYFEDFVYWLVRTFIPRLVGSIFYCSELSSQVTTVYIRQDVWREISRPFLNWYFQVYLHENKDCSAHGSFVASDYNHRYLRLIPKRHKGQFRVLAIPCKGIDEEDKREYEDYVRTVIKPVQQILEYLRMRRAVRFQRLYSPAQIAKYIGEFRSSILTKHKVIPPLFVLKFDIASCYDSIPMIKVTEVVQKLMKDETCFYLRKMLIYDTKHHIIKRKSAVNGNLQASDGSIIIDNSQTMYFSKEEIMSVLEMETKRTAFRWHGNCFLRKDGIFQGSQLSSCLVDIVYDDLLESYKEFGTPPGHASLVMKLADDFLVISTSKEHVDRLKTLLHHGFQDYNASVNRDKVMSFYSPELSDPIFSFCSVNINILKLEVWKPKETYNKLQSYLSSANKLYKKLRWLFESRMAYEITQPTYNSWEAIVTHVEQATINLAETYSTCFSRHTKCVATFSEFIDGIVGAALKNCLHAENRTKRYIELRSIILSSFTETLKKKKSTFAEIVEFLQLQQGKPKDKLRCSEAEVAS